MTLLELTLALPLLLVALAMMSQLMIAGRATKRASAETWQASSAAADVLERMHNAEFRDLFALYNGDPFDDPGGPGTAPGQSFAVEGLLPVEGDSGGFVGEILLPITNVGTAVAPVFELREDLNLPDLGLPRDLTGDQLIDHQDHAADFTLFPVIVRLRWRGPYGPREYRVSTLLSEMR